MFARPNRTERGCDIDHVLLLSDVLREHVRGELELHEQLVCLHGGMHRRLRDRDGGRLRELHARG